MLACQPSELIAIGFVQTYKCEAKSSRRANDWLSRTVWGGGVNILADLDAMPACLPGHSGRPKPNLTLLDARFDLASCSTS